MPAIALILYIRHPCQCTYISKKRKEKEVADARIQRMVEEESENAFLRFLKASNARVVLSSGDLGCSTVVRDVHFLAAPPPPKEVPKSAGFALNLGMTVLVLKITYGRSILQT
jgi:hypothetical protein